MQVQIKKPAFLEAGLSISIRLFILVFLLRLVQV
jgi:hypothetical protein